MPINYLSLEEVLWIHDEIVIKQFGGSYGLLSLAGLESTVAVPAQKMFGPDLYPTLEEKAAIQFWLLVKNHCFLDGNKRTAVLCLIEFLERNGMTIVATQDEVVRIALEVATSTIDTDTVRQWLVAYWRTVAE